MRQLRVPLVLPVATGLAALALATWLYRRDLHEARQRWSLAMEARTRSVEEQIFDVFSSMYEGLRTIARLPGVRAIDRYAANLDSNAKQTIQEIYNNLATRVAMSEVYIVPLDLDPEAIDPTTGRPQEPILTFDELIVGRSADSHQADSSQDDTGTKAPDAGAAPTDESEEVQEIEIFEYRLMRKQLARFRELCPAEDSVHGLAYPALSGPEVVTCDNRYYSARQPDDADRSGLVYSVPLFDPEGRLRGCVSGVILTRALRALLADGCHALRHAGHGYLAGGLDPGVWSDHTDDIAQGRPAADLVFSQVMPIRVVDNEPGWQLWAGRPNADFECLTDVLRARITFAVFAIVGAGLAVGLGLRERANRRRRAAARRQTIELERARDAAESLSLARSNLIAVTSQEIRTPLLGMLETSERLLQSELRSEQRAVVETSRQSARTLLDLLQGILEFSRLDDGDVAVDTLEFDLHLLLEDVVHLLAPVAAQKSIELALMLGDDLPRHVLGDAARLRQVVANLVGNAVKFTNEGSVVVRADWFVAAPQDLLCVRVADTGIGVDPVVRERLFEPFTQGVESSRRGGMGLGLAISKGLVTAMGGTLALLPTTGGSTFVVTVPLSRPTIRTATAPPLARRTALLLVDRPRTRAMLLNDLAQLGARTAAATLADAPELMAADRWDFVLLDRTGEQAAADLLAWIEARSAATAVVLVESWAEPIRGREGLPRCVREVVRAPIGRTSLAAAMLRAARADGRPSPANQPTASEPASTALHPATPAASGPRAAAPEPMPLPAPPAEPATAAPVAANPPTPAHGEAVATPRVLVGDANDTGQLIACAALRRLGCEPIGASSQRDLLELLKQRAFDAILLDLDLPPERDQATVPAIRRIEAAAHRARTPILALGTPGTATPDHGEVAAALVRPLSSKALAAALRQVIDLGARAGQPG